MKPGRCRSYRRGYRCIQKSGHKCAHHYENDWGAFSGAGAFVCAGRQREMENKVANENAANRTRGKWTARPLTAQERIWFTQ